MNDYELVTILDPDIRDEDLGPTLDRINQFIVSRGGEIQNVDRWGRRRLAYPIARKLEGTYIVTLLRLPPARAAELEANLRISEDVLRHLLVRYSPAEVAEALAASQRRRPRPASEELAVVTNQATGDLQTIPASPTTEEEEVEAGTAVAAVTNQNEATPRDETAVAEGVEPAAEPSATGEG